jgi:hypothetical protein
MRGALVAIVACSLTVAAAVTATIPAAAGNGSAAFVHATAWRVTTTNVRAIAGRHGHPA